MTGKKTIIENFHKGTLYEAYNFMGCCFDGDKNEATFRVFAPHASFVSVIGDFNGWDTSVSPMKRINSDGIWEISINNVKLFDGYKFFIRNRDKAFLYKSDPYALHNETEELTNSKVYDMRLLKWDDGKYMSDRKNLDIYRSPVNIYEIHIGSWRKNEYGGYYSYRRFADEICTYVKEMGYTHIELIGIAEYPYDYSWGYQVTGYFSPTSRYGTPADFAYLVNKLHNNGIGVIIDWVPGHFPKNENGLYEFDGEPLYEPSDPQKKEHKSWGTRCFDYARPEVRSFLISNAMMWFDVYHIDGLRVDAVASILYLDYDRNKGEWTPNIYGGNGNLEAVEFFKQLNTAIFQKHNNILMIAEESTSWANVTKPVYLNGLGFNFKWNMGWMNDNLSYINTNPFFRRHEHNKMTFSMTYAFSENFILPISHDEVVYGKRSLLNKMPGNYGEKFAGFRNFLMSMYSHPGKKLMFMGSELASFDEWDVSKQLYWEYLKYPAHIEAFNFVKALNKTYKKYSALWEVDDSWSGFKWLVVDDRDNSIFIYERIDLKGNKMLCVYNFSSMDIDDYSFYTEGGSYTQVLYTDIDGYCADKKIYTTEPETKKSNSRLTLDIKGFCGIYLYKKAAAKRTKKTPTIN